MEMAGEYPDVVIGCVGGGSNYAGLSYPFMADRLAGKTSTRFVATEPAACPTLTKGRFAYDFGDTAELTPLVPMYTLGHTFVPAPVHAGGLRYYRGAPSLSMLGEHGHMARLASEGPITSDTDRSNPGRSGELRRSPDWSVSGGPYRPRSSRNTSTQRASRSTNQYSETLKPS